MKTPLRSFFKPVVMTAFGISVSLSLVAAEPPGKRKTLCCGKLVSTVQTQPSQQAVETSGTPKSADWNFVCPHYMWMDWGNYQSYYASYKYPEWCTPENFDTTGTVDLTGSCEDTTNCIGGATFAKSKQGGKTTEKSYPDDPGDGGYHGLKKPHYTAGDWWVDLSPEDVTVEEIDNFVIAFTQKGTDTYAEVFIGTAQKGEDPKVIVARGLEIKDPTDEVDPRHDYTGNPGQDPLKPAPGGRSHALIYEYGVLRIPIILHHHTPGN